MYNVVHLISWKWNAVHGQSELFARLASLSGPRLMARMFKFKPTVGEPSSRVKKGGVAMLDVHFYLLRL